MVKLLTAQVTQVAPKDFLYIHVSVMVASHKELKHKIFEPLFRPETLFLYIYCEVSMVTYKKKKKRHCSKINFKPYFKKMSSFNHKNSFPALQSPSHVVPSYNPGLYH